MLFFPWYICFGRQTLIVLNVQKFVLYKACALISPVFFLPKKRKHTAFKLGIIHKDRSHLHSNREKNMYPLQICRTYRVCCPWTQSYLACMVRCQREHNRSHFNWDLRATYFLSKCSKNIVSKSERCVWSCTRQTV